MHAQLAKLAALHGVDGGYADVFGEWQATSEEA